MSSGLTRSQPGVKKRFIGGTPDHWMAAISMEPSSMAPRSTMAPPGREGCHVARGRKVLGIRTDLRRAGGLRSSWVNATIDSSCILVKDLEELFAELERLLS